MKSLVARGVAVWKEFPGTFWIIVLSNFIDSLGGAMLFPFLTLYMTKKFSVGMTSVGVLFGMNAILNIVGQTLGGAITDRMGRKPVVITGLICSAFSLVWMGLVTDIHMFFFVNLLAGFFFSFGNPARQAMVADLLVEDKIAEGFGILRITFNLAAVLGPAIGGILATRSYLLIFICDAISSSIVAGIVSIFVRETQPRGMIAEEKKTWGEVFKGYASVLKDKIFMGIMVAGVFMTIVYVQMTTTLPVYLGTEHQVMEQGYGFLMSLNASMVVFLQFFITRRTNAFPPMFVMITGSLLYAIGFSMFGWTSLYASFVLAIIIITIGEMVVAPTSQSLAARLSPEGMRGRYMAVYSSTWTIAYAVGPLMAGILMDRGSPRWVWFFSGGAAVISAVMYGLLHRPFEQLSMLKPEKA